ncbi:hypothetical protein GCM10011498_33350 [Amylibacter cionae]|uniref:Uncharacterized protein n=2 Tax=Neptunicoccus cionae TaxID=2035344 RepID=A0A916VSC2_9RHOB|nr:hypothetical protein GCM10011498_33350 [Amylibacter cionae]
MYSHILQHQSQHGEWFFVNYEDILNQSALPALEEFTGYTPDAQFPDRIYNRTQPEYEVPSAASDVFEALKNQAEISRSRFSA